MSEMKEGVTFINIKFESIKNVEFDDEVVEKEGEAFKQEAIDIPFEVAESFRQDDEAVDVVLPKVAAKRTFNGVTKSSMSSRQLQPEKKKSRLQIKQEATLFDTVHVTQLVKSAFKFYDLNISEFAAFILMDKDRQFVEDLIERPKSWMEATEQEKEVYQTMAKWLHKSIQDRIAPINAELKKKGLPIKNIPDQVLSDLPARKFPKQKSGLRYTSDLIDQLNEDLFHLGVTSAEFADQVLGDSNLSDSVLTHPPIQLDELDSDLLPKFLLIQQWLCLPKDQKRKTFQKIQ